jgi:hypothetical protein
MPEFPSCRQELAYDSWFWINTQYGLIQFNNYLGINIKLRDSWYPIRNNWK